MAKLAPQVVRKPLAERLREGRRAARPRAPNVRRPDGEVPTFFGAYGEWMMTGVPTWDDIAWLREQCNGPLMIKGVTHPDDARQVVASGATALSVSDHGGNNLDGTPATIRALPGVVEAVSGKIEVFLDGGVRRGSDVVKAVALGGRRRHAGILACPTPAEI